MFTIGMFPIGMFTIGFLGCLLELPGSWLLNSNAFTCWLWAVLAVPLEIERPAGRR